MESVVMRAETVHKLLNSQQRIRWGEFNGDGKREM